MTNAIAAPKKFAPGTWRGPRDPNTLREQLMDANRKAGIASRIKRLREDSPYSQEALADRVDVTTRAYQKWEHTGGISYDNAEKLARVHKVDVDYILKGDDNGVLSEQDRLAALEQSVSRLTSAIEELLRRGR